MSTQLDMYDSAALVASKMPDELFTEPDDDWEPVAFLEGEEGRMMIPLGSMMGDEQAKDLLTSLLLPHVIKKTKARSLVMVLSIWQSKRSAKILNEEDKYIPPSQCQDRTEHVMVTEYTAEGVQRKAFAQIHRHEDKPPTLGEWEQMDDATEYSGRFVDPLVKALKEVAT